MSAVMADAGPGYQYHLLRGALERFSRNVAELDDKQLAEARRQADKTYGLESLVLSSAEARDVVIPETQVDEAFGEVLARYPGRPAFESDLAANGLNDEQLRQALRRELAFDSVMQRIASRRLSVSQIDARLYYELHPDKFVVPEQRVARQILVTVNDDYDENRREPALARIEKIAARAQKNPKRFGELARRHSECPSALEGGRLGEIRRGQLFPELDSVLFELDAGAVSGAVETEVGFHLLWCEKVLPSRSVPFSKAEPRIRQVIEERNARNCQKAFLKQLQQTNAESDNR